MVALPDFPVVAAGAASRKAVAVGFTGFTALAEFVRKLPYGRPVGQHDMLAVLREKRGTCSGKHRLLAAVAQECGHSDIELVVGIYAMSMYNTPEVGAVLRNAGVDSIPEAHCYLRCCSQRHDFTGLTGGEESPFQSLSAEFVVSPESLIEDKAILHRQALQQWAANHGFSEAQAWTLREACIAALATDPKPV